MTKDKLRSLGIMAMMASATSTLYINAYEKLTDDNLLYSTVNSSNNSNSRLTNKQKKARAKAKQAKKARRRNR